MISGQIRGHKILFINNEWIFADTKESIENENRPCKKCGNLPTLEGYDSCIGYIPGAISACCGHGVEKGYVKYDS